MTDSSAAPSLIDPSAFDALIFDLGGVILSLHPGRTIDQLSLLYDSDARDAYTQAKQATIFDEFERGEIDDATFRTRVDAFFERRTATAPRDFDDAWNAMLGHIPEDHLELLHHLGKKRRLFLLSNTNTIHIAQFFLDYRVRHEKAHGPWSELFEVAYYSHEMGMRKPEQRIFTELVRRHDLDPERTLFIDDHPGNIEGARLVGLRAELHPTNASLTKRFASLTD